MDSLRNLSTKRYWQLNKSRERDAHTNTDRERERERETEGSGKVITRKLTHGRRDMMSTRHSSTPSLCEREVDIYHVACPARRPWYRQMPVTPPEHVNVVSCRIILNNKPECAVGEHASRKAKLLWMTSHYGPGSSLSWVWLQSQNTHANDPVPDSWPFEPKSIGFDWLSRTTTVPSFKSFQSGVFILSS